MFTSWCISYLLILLTQWLLASLIIHISITKSLLLYYWQYNLTAYKITLAFDQHFLCDSEYNFCFSKPVTCNCKPTSFSSKSAGNFWQIGVLKKWTHSCTTYIHTNPCRSWTDTTSCDLASFHALYFITSHVISTPIFPMHKFNLSYSDCWIHPSLGWLKDLHMRVYLFSASAFVSSTTLCCCCKLIFLAALQLPLFLT